MIKSEGDMSKENLCDMKYLNEILGGNKSLIKEIMDLFLIQVPQELKSIDDAIARTDYSAIKKFAHTVRSSVSILGIAGLDPILLEMELLGAGAVEGTTSLTAGMGKIKELNRQMNLICRQAIKEVEREKLNYV